MKVTNNQAGPRGLNAKDGPVLLDPGQTVDVEMSDAELKVAKATGWFSFAGKDSAKSAEFQGHALKAVHRGGGSYSIMDGDKEVAEKLSKEDAEAFNAMSDEDKAAFVAKPKG